MTELDRDTRILRFLEHVHPYDSLKREVLTRIASVFIERTVHPGVMIYTAGDLLEGLYLIEHGTVEITDEKGAPVSILHGRNSFGERGLTRDGLAVTHAKATEETRLLMLPADEFHDILQSSKSFARFFDRTRSPGREQRGDLTTQRVADLMARNPISISPETSIQMAAGMMRDTHVSCLAVTHPEHVLAGIVTLRDMTTKAVAGGLGGETPVSQIMTSEPVSLAPSALGSDLLHVMLERKIGHVPVTEGNRLVGVLTQTDLIRFQAISSASMVQEIAEAYTAEEMAKVTVRLPKLLMQLVGAGNRHEVVTRLITDIADSVTRRLLALAEGELGAPPVPYLWLACGSQGRQEQTGVSDQDNCMILDDAVTEADMPYFCALAKFVCDGLDTCGYFYCPGDMMATAERWCQPLKVWKRYFAGWIDKPDPEAQMLASVMFDLRPIGGTHALFDNLQDETLAAARKNTIFVGHMIVNSLKHTPPLGLFRGFATVRSGEHKNELDMKMNGVVPVVDLGRVYALQGGITEVNTRARLEAAEALGTISHSGAHDLLDAYDLIAETRLKRQADEIRAGRKPDNYMPPSDLSDLERSHLRDAFVVVRTMQSAVGQGKGMLS
ncbi:DUF294 nucleotidyltransferase-like domain-containing protein [Tropicimonas sp. TH_r6]|uniref:DUF294 nucleotidyltransferase-like domain-containing protein n=1 Tax=Tropicimonas sp. TH_r6 TaxID=3082085 RepID=UPI0029555CF5|nr:DUF294 nucleotidyltransferase-like domain-containing protein [Tropicimonas sp. TH_r6]MDV7143382.1 DUF294 nucleotidyltransferase-like domain-containing protein [Tropicimonas sp. TH_r6]